MFEMIFGCENLEEVYIDGVYIQPYWGGDPAHLNMLEDLGKWLMKRFLVQRGLRRGIQVELVRLWGCRRCRHVKGALVELDNKDMAEVKTRIQLNNAYIASLAFPRPAPII